MTVSTIYHEDMSIASISSRNSKVFFRCPLSTQWRLSVCFRKWLYFNVLRLLCNQHLRAGRRWNVPSKIPFD